MRCGKQQILYLGMWEFGCGGWVWGLGGLFSDHQAPACQTFPLHFISSFLIFNHSTVSFASALNMPQPPPAFRMRCSHQWTTTQNFLKGRETETESWHDPPVSLLGIYQEDLKSVCQKKVCIPCTVGNSHVMESTCILSRWIVKEKEVDAQGDAIHHLKRKKSYHSWCGRNQKVLC